MKEKYKQLSFVSLFILLETPFYVAVFSNIQNKAKILFASIFLVFVFTLFVLCIFKKNLYIFSAIFFTMLADACLEIFDKQYQIPALIFFIVAQTFYYLLIVKDYKNKRLIHLTRFGVSVLITLAVSLGNIKNSNTITVLAVLYICFLIDNVVLAFVKFKKNKLLSLGLTLFLCCDICLGFSLLGSFVNITNPLIKSIGSVDCWIFYLPSQVILGISSLIRK